MSNVFNFIERFAPLSSLQGTIVEITTDKFIIAPEGMISCNFQDDHVVVWYKNEGEDLPRFAQYKNEGEDLPRFAQLGEFVSYQQVATALLPIDLPWGTAGPQDLLAVLESAPEEVLVAYATWAGDFDTERYPSVRETWQWLNGQWGELQP